MPVPTPTTQTPQLRTLVLASRSPRRQKILGEAGFDHTVVTPAIDDADLQHPTGVIPECWVAALAYFKAAAACSLVEDPTALILGADTVCLADNQILGQPRDDAHAESMLRQMARATHRVLSGVALLDPARQSRLIFAESADVTVGRLGEDDIRQYLDSKMWQGKAGAYNLEERIQAGWPIRCVGDPATVMGLPIRTLTPILTRALTMPAARTEEVTR